MSVPKFVARELAAVFGGDRRSGLERRIWKAASHKTVLPNGHTATELCGHRARVFDGYDYMCVERRRSASAAK